MNLPELHICNRIPVHLYQSKMTTGIRKLLLLKIKFFSHFSFNYKMDATAYFHSVLQEQKRRRERRGKDESCVKYTVALKVSIGISLTRKLIPCFFCVLTEGFPAMKSDDPIDQQSITQTSPVSICLCTSWQANECSRVAANSVVAEGTKYSKLLASFGHSRAPMSISAGYWRERRVLLRLLAQPKSREHLCSLRGPKSRAAALPWPSSRLPRRKASSRWRKPRKQMSLPSWLHPGAVLPS